MTAWKLELRDRRTKKGMANGHEQRFLIGIRAHARVQTTESRGRWRKRGPISAKGNKLGNVWISVQL